MYLIIFLLGGGSSSAGGGSAGGGGSSAGGSLECYRCEYADYWAFAQEHWLCATNQGDATSQCNAHVLSLGANYTMTDVVLEDPTWESCPTACKES